MENRFREADDFWNWFGELSYEPTKTTEVILRYGYDYQDDDHPEKFDYEGTQQKIELRAQTDF